MDTWCNCNGSPTQGATSAAAIGNSAMEVCDWRAQLHRQKSVHNIMDTLKMHLSFSRHERLQELEKIAERVEDEVYTAATSQSEYSRKICFMMLSIETRLQNHMPDRSNSAALYNSVNPSVLLAATDNPNGGSWQEEVYQKIKAMKDLYLLDLAAQTSSHGQDWQEEVHQKIKAMKDLYLPDLNDMHRRILSKLQQHDSLPQQPRNEQLEKLKVFKNMLERFMQFLQIPKHVILISYKDKLDTYEKHIINIINSNRRKPRAPQLQAHALPPQHMQSMQQSEGAHSQLTQVQSHENRMNIQGPMTPMLPNNTRYLQQNAADSLSGGSNAQQNIMNSIRPNYSLDPCQNSSINFL
ncbi:hypothetical protein SSX86_006079 [Deinandra increscens subsp. villosa]|uniref:Mediator complex subunit 15 KIX domain-containing protein n=1 Tax=Deinandra increscens subsp. villosa TaxID=3103831 RepID=A0AAP0HAN2_9ASTR